MPLKVDKLSSTVAYVDGNKVVTESVDISYSELYTKIVNSNLTPGQWYRVTDYRSVNFLNGLISANDNLTSTNPNFNPREIYKGDIEVILVQAISSYQIAEVGYSETFQGDIIQYKAYTNKIGVDFEISNGDVLPDSTEISGFDLKWDGKNVYFNMPTNYPVLFGHYFYIFCMFDDGIDNYYQDGLYEPITPVIANSQYPYSFDNTNYPKNLSRISVSADGMKVILLDLTETDYNNYLVDTLYVNTVHAIGDAYGWITKRQDTLRGITTPFDFRGRKYRRFEVDLSSINSDLNTGYYGQGPNYLGQGTTGNYKDFKVFGNEEDVTNVEWNGIGGPDMYWYCGYNDNNLFLSSVYNIKINSNYVMNNTIRNNVSDSFIESSFIFNNTIGSLSHNTINSQDFANNTIGFNFNYNTILGSISSCKILNGFNNNIIEIGVGGLDFTTAVYVYQGYTCRLFIGQNFTPKLSYYDGVSQTVTIVNATA